MRLIVHRVRSVLVAFAIIMLQSEPSFAHLGVDDGHTGGLGIPILLGTIAVVILMLYIAYAQVEEQFEEED